MKRQKTKVKSFGVKTAQYFSSLFFAFCLNILKKAAFYVLVLLLIFYARTVSAQKADTSSVEWVEVYFNMAADHSVAKVNNEANDETELLQTLIDLIEAANYSVDLAVYDLENLKVGEALVRAAERIVEYRAEHSLFKDVEELTNIRGLGPVTMQKLRPYVTIE